MFSLTLGICNECRMGEMFQLLYELNDNTDESENETKDKDEEGKK